MFFLFPSAYRRCDLTAKRKLFDLVFTPLSPSQLPTQFTSLLNYVGSPDLVYNRVYVASVNSRCCCVQRSFRWPTCVSISVSRIFIMLFCPPGMTLWISVAHCTLHFLGWNLSSCCTAATTIRCDISAAVMRGVIFVRRCEAAVPAASAGVSVSRGK